MKTQLFLTLFVCGSGALNAAIEPEKKLTAEQSEFFEKKIRPVLADKCYKCHSEKSEKVKGGLLLDTREGIRRGGDSGAAVVPGNLKDSVLIEAVRYTNKDFAMPPEKQGGKLPDAIIKDFEDWVKMGAPDPRDGAAKVVKKYDTEAAKQWWSFHPPQKQTVPQPKDATWAMADTDRFLLAALDAKKLKPVADADGMTLLRRVYFDLTGLPPSPQEALSFWKEWQAATTKAQQQAVLAKSVDRLLASAQFGERWGRHWLDVARYAESSGKDVNIAFPHAWRYRDYVIASFNADKPFDQFVREQIAGDLQPSGTDSQRAERITATGFLAIGPKGLNEQNGRQFCLDLADEQVDTVSQAFLGMTIACARCHDHKFDPIPQRDYYAMAGIFLSTDTRYGTAVGIQNRHASELIELPAGYAPTMGKTLSAEELAGKEQHLAELRKEQQENIAARIKSRVDGKDGQLQAADQRRALAVIGQLGQLDAELKNYDTSGKQKALAMGAQDLPASKGEALGRGVGKLLRRAQQFRQGRPPEFASIGDSALYTRGDASKPAEQVPRGFPTALSTASASIPHDESGRKELAEWIASPTNPLTSRVIVNRVWHWMFGRGIVESVDNFGNTGKKPDNQALLDFLAVKFSTPIAQGGYGWSVKHLIRDITLSRAYQLSSDYNPADFAADPENALVWRMSKRRLDAECIRDAMLAASGQLQLDKPAPTLIARSGDAPIGGPRLMGVSEDQLINSGSGTSVRSVYLPIARDVPPDALAVFDFSDASLVTGARDTTNVPAQALYLLNSDFAAKCAAQLAERIASAYPSGPAGGATANLDQRLGYAYWLTLGRAPTPAEKAATWNFFQKFPSNWSKGDKSQPGMKDASDDKAAWTSFCRALFASSDFRFLN